MKDASHIKGKDGMIFAHRHDASSKEDGICIIRSSKCFQRQWIIGIKEDLNTYIFITYQVDVLLE